MPIGVVMAVCSMFPYHNAFALAIKFAWEGTLVELSFSFKLFIVSLLLTAIHNSVFHLGHYAAVLEKDSWGRWQIFFVQSVTSLLCILGFVVFDTTFKMIFVPYYTG